MEMSLFNCPPDSVTADTIDSFCFLVALCIRPDLLDVLLLEPGGSKFFNFRKKKKKLSRDSCSRVPKMVDSLWLGVKVVCGSRVLFGSKIVNCSKEETFGNLISRSSFRRGE